VLLTGVAGAGLQQRWGRAAEKGLLGGVGIRGNGGCWANVRGANPGVRGMYPVVRA
jgi:hypothetical protein